MFFCQLNVWQVVSLGCRFDVVKYLYSPHVECSWYSMVYRDVLLVPRRFWVLVPTLQFLHGFCEELALGFIDFHVFHYIL